jgi:prophage regulatory protein
LLRQNEVLARTGLRETQQRNLEQRRQFPQRVLLGPRTVAWREDEINEWIAARTGPRQRK